MSSQTTLSAHTLSANTIKCNKLHNRLNNVVTIPDGTSVALTSSGHPSGSLIKLEHDGTGENTITLPKAKAGYTLDFLIVGANDDTNPLNISY